MTRPWRTLASAPSSDGVLDLRQRGPEDFLITLAGRVLMNSRGQRSEVALAELGCAALGHRSGARVLVGGLGMGITLRALLDALPADARVTVAELNPVVVDWCSGPLAALNRHALDDRRVQVVEGDVADVIAGAASNGYDAILLDLYTGPHPGTPARDDPVYGSRALALSHAALRPRGVLGVWSEGPERGFEKRLRSAGFAVELARPGRGGRRHAVYIATRGG